MAYEQDNYYSCRMVAWQCHKTIQRAVLAYHYVNDTMTADDANEIIYHCQPGAGWYPLETLDEVGVLECLTDRYEDRPEFPDLVHRACRRVWSKWSGNGEATGAAQDWAIELVASYAADDGVELVEREDSPLSRFEQMWSVAGGGDAP